MKPHSTKGQGAVTNVEQRFTSLQLESYYDDMQYEDEPKAKLELTKVFPKTIVNHNKGGNVPERSMNPYQGCEHGCSYCYARPTHEFWSLNAGVDFERKIMYKPNAPELLKQYFAKKNYIPKPIALSGNTDCYQPIESKLKITQAILKTFLAHRHPVGIITKNALILRDLEILKGLASMNLVHVILSINSLDEDLRRVMEPRTSTVKNRLDALRVLRGNGISAGVLIAPIIPALNSEDVIPILKVTSEIGATSTGYTIIRLNDTTQPVFTEWLENNFPDRKDKVLNHIRGLYKGELGNLSTFQKRGGKGNMVDSIKQSFAIGRKKYFGEEQKLELSTEHFIPKLDGQLKLF